MNTFFAILAEFETAQIPLEKCAHLFGMTPKKAAEHAAKQSLPIPAFKIGAQKSPWLIDARTLAEHIDKLKTRASDDWQKLNT